VEIVYFADERGTEPVREYIDRLQATGEFRAVAMVVGLIDILADLGPMLRPPRSKLIDERQRICELRAGDHRVAYAFRGNKAVLLCAWRKQGQRLDRRHARRARQNLESYDRTGEQR
jgi:plasmid stabilization system protein ParE